MKLLCWLGWHDWCEYHFLDHEPWDFCLRCGEIKK